MKAIQVPKCGGAEVLTLIEVPTPKPKPNEVLVKISAAGVNYIDCYFREGRYPATPPFILGQEASGVVSEVGSDVKDFKPGDRVAYTGITGAYAEYEAVPADRLVRVPAGITDHQAAAAMLQGMTAHYLSESTFPAKSGDIALVHAGAGGTGLLLIQLLKMKGVTVYTTVSTPDKAKLAKQAGADETILYKDEDFVARVKELSGGKGIDVVYDSVGLATYQGGFEVLRPRGMLVLFGQSSGKVPPIDPIILSEKGSLFLTRPSLAHHTAERQELRQRANKILGLVGDGALQVRIERRYPLSEVAQAHRDLESRGTTGKLLIEIAS